MKKLLFSLLAVGVTSVLAVGATRAFFTDTATLGANTVNTGTIDIEIGETIIPMDVDNLMPGEWSSSNPFAIYNVSTVNPVEFKIESLRTGGNLALFNELDVKVTLGSPYPPVVLYDGPLADLEILSATDLAPDSTRNFTVEFYLPEDAGNSLQGKTATFSFVVTAAQVGANLW